MRSLVLLCVLACSSKQGTPTNGSGGGGSNEPPLTGCDGAKHKVGELYRAESVANKDKPERVEEAVADNTAMVMNECVKAPKLVVDCIGRVKTAGELEKQCLAQLDEEGSEGEALRK
jgi:hypothetical protein